jgi:hypothetical protein
MVAGSNLPSDSQRGTSWSNLLVVAGFESNELRE